MKVKCVSFVHAKRERYLTALTFADVRRLFGEMLSIDRKKVFAGELQAAMKEHGQRALNVKRAQDIARYIKANPDDWILPPVVLSIDGECQYKNGSLQIDPDASWHIVDGQHRTAGALLAVLDDPLLEFVGLPAMLVTTYGKAQDRQAFADINGNSCKVSLGKNVLFNGRDERARWVQNLEDNHLLRVYCDFKNNTAKGGAFFSVAGLYAMAKEFAEEHLFTSTLQASALARTEEHLSGIFGSIVVQTALCRVVSGSTEPVADVVEAVAALDWSRESWEGVCVFNGALSKSGKLVTDTALEIRVRLAKSKRAA